MVYRQTQISTTGFRYLLTQTLDSFFLTKAPNLTSSTTSYPNKHLQYLCYIFTIVNSESVVFFIVSSFLGNPSYSWLVISRWMLETPKLISIQQVRKPGTVINNMESFPNMHHAIFLSVIWKENYFFASRHLILH